MANSLQSWMPRVRCLLSLHLAALSGAAVLVGGCAEQKKPAVHWGTAVLVRPTLVRAPLPASDQIAEAEPDLQMEIPASFPPLPPGHTVPARPHVPVSPAAANPPPAKPDSPQLVPELTAQESTSLQRETEQSLNAAERNLAATTGKSLSAPQTDLASKVHSFVAEAREAARTGDWARARALAKKAQVLSEELVGSL